MIYIVPGKVLNSTHLLNFTTLHRHCHSPWQNATMTICKRS